MEAIEQIINSITFQLTLGIILGGLIYTLGFHSGNKFRLSRLNLRTTKEIREKINGLNHELNVFENRIEAEYQKEKPDQHLIQAYVVKKAKALAKRDTLFWVINANEKV